MTKPVNNDSCCRFLTGAARHICQKVKSQQPVIGKPQRTKITDKEWQKFVKCRETQVVHKLMVTRFDKSMAQVKKTSQSVAKSDGVIAGALVLLVGTIGAALDAAAQKTHSDMLIKAFLKSARSDSIDCRSGPKPSHKIHIDIEKDALQAIPYKFFPNASTR
jgi:hypothetical protein